MSNKWNSVSKKMDVKEGTYFNLCMQNHFLSPKKSEATNKATL